MFDKSLLPPPSAFYQLELGRLGKPNRKGWRQVLRGCPFHDSKSKKSFFINVDGGFYCHGCHASGGSVIDFLIRRESYSFKKACQILGCWREDGARYEPPPKIARKFLTLDFVIGGQRFSASVPDE
jgi:hypothetical protein